MNQDISYNPTLVCGIKTLLFNDDDYDINYYNFLASVLDAFNSNLNIMMQRINLLLLY